MAKSANQKLKLFYLLKILQEKTDEEHTITIAEIINLLNIYGINAERKSIYSDLELLNQYGFDILCNKSKAYGYYMASRLFELPELKLLVDAVQSSKFITHIKTVSLIKKIEGLASSYQAQQLQRQVYVVNRVKTKNESIYYNVDKIYNAISNNNKIEFKYFEWIINNDGGKFFKKNFRREGGNYIISPFALTWDNEYYYMVGFDKKAEKIKHYRVDKMEKIEICDEKREGLDYFKKFDMAIYVNKVFGMYGGEEKDVSLKCSNSLIGVILDRFGKDITVIKNDNEHFIINIKVEVSPLFSSWVFCFGSLIKIISPSEVVEQFKKQTQDILDKYN